MLTGGKQGGRRISGPDRDPCAPPNGTYFSDGFSGLGSGRGGFWGIAFGSHDGALR